ncbi:MAG: 2-succinyl-5-enolpyruvyl-6-hydroxy-3-cyclohexene-1-carboxylic-acid synthase [Actinomycetota bacterium]
MSAADTQYRAVRGFVAALTEAGVRIVALGAGSRSTPLALAFADDGRFRIFSHVDERSAGFFALGAARVSGKPAVVVTTSGTAVANLAPACVEAEVAGVPLICVTADRPRELHDVGATQTVEQIGLLRSLWTTDLPAWDAGSVRAVTHAGSQAVAVASGPPPGPIHVNLRFREPLTPSSEARSEAPDDQTGVRRSRGRLAPADDAVARVAGHLDGHARGLIHIGHLEGAHPGLAQAVSKLARATGYPVIVEATSRLRGTIDAVSAVDASEALIRDEAFAGSHRPEVILRIGRAPLTRAMSEWFAGLDAEKVVISPHGLWPDPGRDADAVLAGDPLLVCEALVAAVSGKGGNPEWQAGWRAASAAAREAIDAFLDASDVMFEGTAARAVARALPSGGLCYVATSLPIRALDAFTQAEARLDAFANRGASGIDGTVSAALGAAAASGRPTVCLTGDLAFLHDVGAMLTIARHRVPLVIVVIDNGGGGIFEFLPQSAAIDRDQFEDLFVTSHRLDLMRAAEMFDTGFAAARDAASLERALEWAFTSGTPQLVRVQVNREASVRAHRQALEAAWDAVSRVQPQPPGA